MSTPDFDISPQLASPPRPLIDPSPHFAKPGGPITLDSLETFFSAAFLPNHEGFVRPVDFASLTALRQSSYIKHIHTRHPDGPLDRIRILDLASGDAPYLRHLFACHANNACADQVCSRFRMSVARKVSYVGVNTGIPQDYLNQMAQWSDKFKECFEAVHFLDANLVEDAGWAKILALAAQDPFDRVIMSNAWHELPASRWAFLVAQIPGVLKKGGKFMLLDLEHPMMLEDHTSMHDRIAKGLSFWEADALYLSQSAAEKLMRAVGLQCSHTSNFDDLQQPWWWVEGKRGTRRLPQPRQRLRKAHAVIQTAISEQSNRWRSQSKRERRNVVQVFSQTSDLSARLFVSIQYLCLSASQTVRDEHHSPA